ncbi:unnamed protein product [Urochloa decumbens]|uniref:DUF7769 domain-containing protein n=1 Tax=Urochloa decumbens TaxID=240449 RepID=A0ABC8YF86_9POAL
MHGIEFDLNENPPESEVHQNIVWDSIAEFDGPAHDLDYAMVWDEGTQDEDVNDAAAHEDVEAAAADPVQGDVHRDVQGDVEASAADPVQGDVHGDVQEVYASIADVVQGDLHDAGSSGNKRRFYSDDLKMAIYLELLAKTDPPILRRGVSKGVARKFDVPLRVVQSIWKKGQASGINGVVNKWSKKCGRKRIEIDLESIKNVPLRQRTTFKDLANALGVEKSTLHNRFKEGYFRRHTNDLKFSLTDDKCGATRRRGGVVPW